MQRVADHRLVTPLDAGGDRWWAEPPDRLADLVGGADVVVELHQAGIEAVLGRLVAWAEAAGAAAGRLAVPLEAGTAAEGMTWVARTVPGGRTGRPLDVAGVAAAASGVAALHGAGVVHGALGTPRLLGSVVDLPPWRAEAWPLLQAARATDLDTVAPELLRGELPGPGADVWALGALLVLAAGDRHARPAIAEVDLLAGLVLAAGTPPDLTGLEPPVAEVAARCLDADPDGRPTAREVADALEGVRR